MPDFIDPMLATLASSPFDDADWLFEVKWDGFRVEAVVRDGEVRTWTRGKKDAATYFGSFLAPPTWIDAGEAIVDGEVVAFGEDGEPDFALLGSRSGGLAYVIFDLLWLDGESLLARPLEERKARLEEVLRDDPRVRLSTHVQGEGLALHAAAEARHLEGIMAKDRRSPYEPGRRAKTWLKVKIRPEQELVVGGWTFGTGSATDLGALLVGVHENGVLRYVGKVGAGFTRASRATLLAALAPLAADASPFSPPPPRSVLAGVRWVRPELVIRAEFAGWTGGGSVRQASYKGFDLGKDPRLVVREVPGAPPVP